MKAPHSIKSLACALMWSAAIVFGAGAANAQCDPQWLAGNNIPGVDGPIFASTMWDPDGAGPLPARLVIAGAFTNAGGVVANRIAVFDPETGQWSTLGSGFDFTVRALTCLLNGDLVAAGEFQTAGGTPINSIAKWNGLAWSALGSGVGLGTHVRSLCVLPNGNLIVGVVGYSGTGETPPPGYLLKWNGATWSTLASYVNYAYALACLPNGNLVAAGYFGTMQGGVIASGLALWNGSTWSAFGSGLRTATGGSGLAYALKVLPNGDLVVAGTFESVDGVPASNIARWNGTSWSALGSGITGSAYDTGVKSLASLPDGSVLAGGIFTTAGGQPATRIARWDGSAWSALGSGVSGAGYRDLVTYPYNTTYAPAVYTITTLPSGAVAVAGAFSIAGDLATSGFMLWDGAAWLPTRGQGVSGLMGSTGINALALDSGGALLAGGSFTGIGSTPVSSLARWDGTAWAGFSTELSYYASGPGINSMAVELNGDVLVCGQFRIGGVDQSVARWNGNSWQPLGAIGGYYVECILPLENGEFIAGGEFTSIGGVPANAVARWNGTSWSALGPGFSGWINTLVGLADGSIVAGGYCTVSGSQTTNWIARWDGASWNPLGAGLNDEVDAALVLPSGDLIVGGRFTTAGGAPANCIARWNGSVWSALGSGTNGQVNALTLAPNGDLVAGGYFSSAGGVAANRIARWNGSAWAPLGSGTNGSVSAVIGLPNGELVAAGPFTTAGGIGAAGWARWTEYPTVSILTQPESQRVCTTEPVVLSSTPTFGFTNMYFEWSRNGVLINNGPGGASPGGGTVSGAFGSLPSPTDGAPAVVTIAGATPGDSGDYTVTFYNACDSAFSAPATIAVCAADFNCDGFIDPLDYNGFINAFEAADMSADFNGDGFLDPLDYNGFINAFEAGC